MELIYNHRIGKLRDASIRLAKIADDSKDDETRVEFEIYSWAVFWAMHKLRESSMCIQPTDEAIEAKAKEMCEADPTNREATKCGAGGYYDWTTYKMRAEELLFRESEVQGQEVDTQFHRHLVDIKSYKRIERPVSVDGEESAADNTPRITMVDGVVDIVNNAVDHPKHYLSHPSGIKCIEIVRHENFNIGNAMKYIWRRNDKGNPEQDLKKAMWYLQDEINRLQKQQKEKL